jgi:hypothetical protein
MRFEIENGKFVGTAEYEGSGRVALDVADESQRAFFDNYFRTEEETLSGTVDCPEFNMERPTDSPEAFERAMGRLMAHAYKTRRVDSSRTMRSDG